ncbi:MAG: hypothetical protein ACRDQ4_02980 [Pseudonocardiaceae bacterium]
MSGSNAARVCLTFNRKIKTTAVMTNQQTAQLCELLNKATTPRHGKTRTVS